MAPWEINKSTAPHRSVYYTNLTRFTGMSGLFILVCFQVTETHQNTQKIRELKYSSLFGQQQHRKQSSQKSW